MSRERVCVGSASKEIVEDLRGEMALGLGLRSERCLALAFLQTEAKFFRVSEEVFEALAAGAGGPFRGKKGVHRLRFLEKTEIHPGHQNRRKVGQDLIRPGFRAFAARFPAGFHPLGAEPAKRFQRDQVSGLWVGREAARLREGDEVWLEAAENGCF